MLRLCMQQSQQSHMIAFALLDLFFGHTIRQRPTAAEPEKIRLVLTKRQNKKHWDTEHLGCMLSEVWEEDLAVEYRKD